MKNLIVLTALISLFSLTSAKASVATSVYGQIFDVKGGYVFSSLEEDTYGAEVEIDGDSFATNYKCSEGIFTLVQSLRKDRSYEVIDVVCEELETF